MAREQVIPAERIERAILLLRGQKVLLDSDLAELYGVETRALVQAVKRNSERFPPDFVFQLSPDEIDILRSQSVISSRGHGGRRSPPYAFTEQGVAMLSSVLRSHRAIEVNIAIMRAFVRLREILATHKDLAHRLDDLERKVGQQDENPLSLRERVRVRAACEPIRFALGHWPHRRRPSGAASVSRPSQRMPRQAR